MFVVYRPKYATQYAVALPSVSSLETRSLYRIAVRDGQSANRKVGEYFQERVQYRNSAITGHPVRMHA